EPVLQRDRRFPAELLQDEGVVAVATADTLRRREVVVALELDAGDALDYVDEVIDRHELRRAEVDRIAEVALHDPEHSADRVVDVREAARLHAVAPDLDRVRAVELRRDD